MWQEQQQQQQQQLDKTPINVFDVRQFKKRIRVLRNSHNTQKMNDSVDQRPWRLTTTRRYIFCHQSQNHVNSM